MADHDQRAGPRVQVVLDHRQGVDVQVVGRLVEQQHVGFGQQQSQELQPASFATRQVIQPGRQPVLGEAEVFEQRARARLSAAGERGDAALLLHDLQHPLGPGELADVLAQMPDLQGPAAFDAPGVRGQLAHQQPQQGRLAGAIDPDQTDPHAGPDRPAEVVEQHPPLLAGAHTVGDVDQVEDVFAEPADRELLQGELVSWRRLVGDQRVRRIDPELRLRCPRGRSRRSQASSLRNRFFRRVAIPAACRDRSARARTYAA